MTKRKPDTRPPPIPADKQRLKMVSVRLTHAEFDRIESAAHRTGSKVSQYLRIAALEKVEAQK